jgi:hypothetical protein
VRQTFVDDRLHDELVHQGFVRLPLLDADELAAFRAAFDDLSPADRFDPPGGLPTNPTTYHCTFLDTDLAYKAAFDRLVRDTFERHVEALFDDYTILTANCYAKQPDRGQFEVHQNWNLTPDPSDITVTVWVPLQDTDEENGTLMVVPGSHKLTRDIAYPRGGHYFGEYDQRIAEHRFVPLPVRAGEAVAFDDSLVHGSATNRAGAPRFALQMATIPAEAQPVVYRPTPEGTFDLLEAPARFYLETTLVEIDEWPDRFARVGSAPNRNRSVPEHDFDRLLADGPQVRNRLWGFPLP